MQNSLPAAGTALSDLLSSLRLGLRDSIRPAILLISLLTAVLAFALCTLLFALFWTDIHGAGQRLAGWAVQGALSMLPLEPGPVTTVQSLTVSLLTGLLLLFVYVLAILAGYRLALEFVLMPRISRIIRLQYPLLQARGIGLGKQIRLLLRTLFCFVLLAPLLLILPLVGGPLLFALAAYLLVRSLMVDALEDMADAAEIEQLLRGNRWGMLVLGLLLSALVVIPPLGLLAPGLIGSCVCHFGLRRLQALRQRM